MSDDRLARAGLSSEDSGTERKGRPTLKWKDIVKRDLEKMGVNREYGRHWQKNGKHEEFLKTEEENY